MKQLLEFLPLVLFFAAYQIDGELVTVGSWSHTFDGIFSATAVLMVSSSIVWLLASALSRHNERRLMWMAERCDGLVVRGVGEYSTRRR